jgi:sortase A
MTASERTFDVASPVLQPRQVVPVRAGPEVAAATSATPPISVAEAADSWASEDAMPRRLTTALAWVRNIGALVLIFVGWQLFGTAIAEHRAQATLATQFAAKVREHPRKIDLAPKGRRPTLTTTTTLPDRAKAIPVLLSRRDQLQLPAPAIGSLVARLQIPKIGVDQFVVEGTAESNLAEGPGHYIGTALPGYAGNVAIAGHRTTYGAPFNDLANVTVGDSIFLTTTDGERLRYVVRTRPVAVAPTDVAVLRDFGDDRITLTTCTPEFSAAQRLVVVAELFVPTPVHAISSVSNVDPTVSAIEPSPFAAPMERWRLRFNPTPTTDLRSVVPPRIVLDSTGWDLANLPLALFALALMTGLGLRNRRLVRRLGKARGWLLLTPIWVVLTFFAIQALGAVVPANL